MKTKTYPLNTILTVTTGRLLTTPKNGGNGIEDLYSILEWMTGESPYTHSLPCFAEECKPFLFKTFPELAVFSTNSALKSLDGWISKDRTPDKSEFLRMWFAEMFLMFPNLKKEYDIPRLPKDIHKNVNPLQELVGMMEK